VSTEQILQAADRIARLDGLDHLTIRSLCAELEVTAPAVYRHFESKEEFVEEVIDRIIGRTELPGPEVGDWATRLQICFVSVHDAVAPYSGLAARLGQEFPHGAASARNHQYLVSLIAEAGISDTDGEKIIFTVFVYTWGHLLAWEAQHRALGMEHSLQASRERFLWGFDRLLDSFRREFGPRRQPKRGPNTHRRGPRPSDRSSTP
jgi:AcrR family transcriptional regulator